MALRVLAYAGLPYQDLVRRGAAGPGGELPPVLPIGLSNGRSPWTAALELRQTLAPVGGALARYQRAQRYFVLEVGRPAEDDLPRRNPIPALLRLECSRAVATLIEWVRGSGESELERFFAEWIGQVPAPGHSGEKEGGLPPGTKLEEIPAMLAEAAQEWYAREREVDRAEQRALLRRQPARWLDAATAERLAENSDPERLAEVGEWPLECGHGDELLQWVERLCGTSGPGDVLCPA